MHFIQNDRDQLAALEFDPDARPSFDPARACLVWPDERAEGLSRIGHELLGELWRIRGYLHQALPPSRWGPNPTHARQVWNNALTDRIRWPGFQRLVLSEAEQELLETSLARARLAEVSDLVREEVHPGWTSRRAG